MDLNDDEAVILPVKKYSNDEIENEVDEEIKVEIKVEDEDVSDDDEVVLKCEGCGVDFTSKEALEKHQKEKHDHRKFVCKHCGKAVMGKDALRYHERSHNKVQCDSCDRMFSSKNISIHKQKCKGKVPVTKGKHVCDQCGYQTNQGSFQK